MAKSSETSALADRNRGRWDAGPHSLVQFRHNSNAREIEKVRWFTQHLDRPGIRPIAIIVNRLSNGVLYALIGVLFWFAYGSTGAVLAAAAALGVAHIVYPVIKRHYRRKRPFHFDRSVPSLLPPLDEHSFPSGHMMSCVAVMIPLCVAVPAMVPWTVGTLILVGWGRLVAGHHYPSDLAAGGLLGGLAAMPMVAAQMSFG